jgi:hypothetical protein
MPKRSRRSPSTRKPGTSTPPVTALIVSAVARSSGGSLHLHISVMRSDGSPVTGLSCGNFQVRIGYDVFPTSMQPVPTTFLLPRFDKWGEPVLDEEGNQIQDLICMIYPQGLPGFYALSVNAAAAGCAVQIHVQAGTSQGQIVIAP